MRVAMGRRTSRHDLRNQRCFVDGRESALLREHFTRGYVYLGRLGICGTSRRRLRIPMLRKCFDNALRGPTFAIIFCEAAPHNLSERLRQIGWNDGVLRENRSHQLMVGRISKWRLSSERFENEHSQRPHVPSRRNRSFEALRGHVGNSPSKAPCMVSSVTRGLPHGPEVRKLPYVPNPEYVRRLQVAMYELLLVKKGEGRCKVLCEDSSFLGSQARLLEPHFQAPLREFHDKVEELGLAERDASRVKTPQEVRMLKRRSGD